MAPQVAYLGLGNIGRGMSKNLAEKANLDKPLTIWNRTTKRAEDLSASLPAGKSTVAKTVQEAAAKSDVIFSCLLNDQAVQSVYEAAAKEDIKGKLFVDCSTIHPDTSEVLAKTVIAQGAEFVSCPVFGAPAMADAGQLLCVLAGPKSSIEKVIPYCKGIVARGVIRFDDEPVGRSLLLKVIGNSLVLNMVEALAEAHTMSEKTGLENEKVHEFIEAMFPGPYVAYSTRMLGGDYYKRDEPLFSAAGARKDIRHARNLAEAAGARLPALEVADAHLAKVEKAKAEKGDLAGIYGACREEAGLPYERK